MGSSLSIALLKETLPRPRVRLVLEEDNATRGNRAPSSRLEARVRLVLEEDNATALPQAEQTSPLDNAWDRLSTLPCQEDTAMAQQTSPLDNAWDTLNPIEAAVETGKPPARPALEQTLLPQAQQRCGNV